MRRQKKMENDINDYAVEGSQGLKKAEQVIKRYPVMLQELQRMKKGCHNKAVLKEMQQCVNAVQYALQVIQQENDTQKMALIELKYTQKGLTNQMIQEQLCISKSTYYRWRNDFLKLVADQMGDKF